MAEVIETRQIKQLPDLTDIPTGAALAMQGDEGPAGQFPVEALLDRVAPIASYAISTFAAISTANIPAIVQQFRVLSYAEAGDCPPFNMKRVEVEPAHPGKAQSADGAWWEIAEAVLNVRMFGANGSAGDAARIQNAVDTGLALGVLQVFAPSLPGAAAYQLDGVVQNNGVRIYGDGQTRFQRVGQGSAFKSGSVPALGGTTLAADAAAFARTITLSSVSGFAAGDLCFLRAEDKIHANTPNKKGEFVTIESIAGSDVIFTGPLLNSYATANSAKLQKIAMAQNVMYDGFTIIMDDTVVPTNGLTWFENFGLDFKFCYRPRVRDVLIKNNPAAGVFLTGCLYAKIDVEVEDLGSADNDTDGSRSDGLGGYGYGVIERAMNKGASIDVNAVRSRHAYTTGGGYASVFEYGEPYASNVTGSHFEAKEAGFDTHETGRNITFNNPRTFGGNSFGHQIRSKRTRVISPEAVGTKGPAVWLYGANVAANAAGDECLVTDVFAESTNLGPADAYHGSEDWTTNGAIRDQSFDSIVRGGLICRVGGPVYSTNSSTRRGKITGIVAIDPCQLAAAAAQYGALLNQTGTDNPVIRDFHVLSNDAKVIGLVRTGNSACTPFLSDISGVGHTGDIFSSSGGGTRFLKGGYGPHAMASGHRKTYVISADAINARTIIGGNVALQSETGTADDLVNITNPEEGMTVIVAALTSHTITLKHGTGNLRLKGSVDAVLNANSFFITLRYLFGAWWETTRNF